MKRHYVKVLSVASVVASLCAANASYADDSTVAVGPAGAVDVQSDFNEDIPRHRDPAQNPAMNPNFDLVSEVNKVDIDFMATIEARYSLYDQTREQNFDFLNQLALFGVHMYKNGWSADLLVRFAGNPLRSSSYVANPNNDLNWNHDTVDTVGSVGIRKASIGYKLYQKNGQQLKFTLGRFAPYGETAYDDDNVVRAWGTDATVNLWGPNGSGDLHGTYVDGASLSWQGKWSHVRVNAEATVASDLPVFLYMLDRSGHFNLHTNPYQVFGNDSSFGQLTTNTSRAWLGDAAFMYSANWGDIQAAIDFGGKNNAETNVSGSSAFARDMYYVAASLGYTMKDKMAVGAWYNWVKVKEGEAGTIVPPDEAVNSYATVPGLQSGNYSVFGIGINGSSKMWSQNHVGGKGGVLTWGGGYQRFMTRDGFNAAYANSAATEDSDVNMYSLAFGWARGPVTLEADWALFAAKDKVFYRDESKEADGANVVYLVGTFDI